MGGQNFHLRDLASSLQWMSTLGPQLYSKITVPCCDAKFYDTFQNSLAEEDRNRPFHSKDFASEQKV